MENQPISASPTTVNPPTGEIPVPPTQIISPPKAKLPILALLLGAIIVLSTGLVWLTAQINRPQVSTPGTGQGTSLPLSPTPQRLLSAVATQSGFLVLEERIASLSASLRHAVIQDPTLSPPMVELSLGFPN